MVIALAGCTPPAPEPGPSATASPSDSPSTPTPTPEPLTIVGCETLLPIEDARAAFADSTEFLGERPPTESGGWFPLAEIDSTLAASEQARACTWGIPDSDGAFTVHVAEVTPEQRTSLEAALTAEGFSDVTMGTVTGYDLSGENEVFTIAATHLFTGDVWIMANAHTLSTTGQVAAAVLDALRTANPTLGL